MEIKKITGGVCAAKGFTASGVHCGIRRNRTKRDLSLILSEKPASAAAVYTSNLVKGAPLAVTKAHIADGYARAVICNSGNANTCNADGVEVAEKTCELLAKELGIGPEDVVVASTGVIGQPLDIAPIAAGIPELVKALSPDGCDDAAEGIMTTDTVKKEVAVEFELGGKICRMGGIAKGSGMIHPNLATMLVFITTDAAVAPAMLDKALKADVKDSFNMVSVDGDTSTNDMVTVLANGAAGNETVDGEGEDFDTFRAALAEVTKTLCRMIAGDGEGDRREGGHHVVPPQSRHVRRGRQLGPCALRHRIQRGGCGSRKDRRGIRQQGWEHPGLRKRRGGGVLRRAGEEDPLGGRDPHPGLAWRR